FLTRWTRMLPRRRRAAPRSVPMARAAGDVVVMAPCIANGAARLGPEQPRIVPAAQPVVGKLRLDFLEALAGMRVARQVAIAVGRRVIVPVASGRVIRRIAEGRTVVRLVVSFVPRVLVGMSLHGRAIGAWRWYTGGLAGRLCVVRDRND